jgi:hypothetical protein
VSDKRFTKSIPVSSDDKEENNVSLFCVHAQRKKAINQYGNRLRYKIYHLMEKEEFGG